MAIFLVAGCTDREDEQALGVRSYLEGWISVSEKIDSSHTLRVFEVAVVNRRGERFDTLGYAQTDSTGHFRMNVAAPEKGVYPLVISLRDTVVKVEEMVVAEGDSATFRVVLPTGPRPIIIRSRENGAWLAYNNTRAQHSRRVFELMKTAEQGSLEAGRLTMQTVGILWSMRETFPNTLGADLATAQSIVMLAGVNDSLLVTRANGVQPTNPAFVEVARAAWKAQARMFGHRAGLELLQGYRQRAQTDEDRAAIQSEIVVAYMDGGQPDRARDAAQQMRTEYAGTEWAGWADRTGYDLDHLMPGMPAPPFQATTLDGRAVSLGGLKGRYVLLEFYEPQDGLFLQELGGRNALYEATRPYPFEIVSVSVNPDSAVTRAFLQRQPVPGFNVVLPDTATGMSTIADQYNVYYLPRRVLIDREGRIVSRYDGSSISILQQEVARLLARSRAS